MSKLEKLIKKLCPNGVEYKELNTLVDYIQPTKYIVKSTKYNDEYDIPVLTPGQTFILGYTNEKEGIYNADKENPIILFDDFTTAFRWINFKFKVKSSAVKILIPKNNNINFRYIFYTMQTIKFDNTQHNRQWISKYSILKIPVPPIEVQNEIVRILDNFIELATELEAELEAREKQYEYYKDKILKFSKKDLNVEWINLGTYCNRLKGTAITASKMKEISENDGNIKIFAGGKTVTKTSEKNIPKEDIITVPNIIVQSRGIIDFIYYDKPCSFKREMWSYTTDNNITLKFIYYYLKNNVKYFRQRGSQMGSMPQISLDVTEKYKIPILPIEEQERIVSILDRFDKLCNDITQGLPAEIEARRKQYEYYRDKLLNFKETKNG